MSNPHGTRSRSSQRIENPGNETESETTTTRDLRITPGTRLNRITAAELAEVLRETGLAEDNANTELRGATKSDSERNSEDRSETKKKSQAARPSSQEKSAKGNSTSAKKHASTTRKSSTPPASQKELKARLVARSKAAKEKREAKAELDSRAAGDEAKQQSIDNSPNESIESEGNPNNHEESEVESQVLGARGSGGGDDDGDDSDDESEESGSDDGSGDDSDESRPPQTRRMRDVGRGGNAPRGGNTPPGGNAPSGTPGGNAPNGTPTGAPNNPPLFFLTPGMAVQGKFLDFSKKIDIDIYNKGSTALNSDQLFDARADGLNIFLKDLEARARDYGWTKKSTGVLDVIRTQNQVSTHYNLLKDYGQVSIDDVRNHATYNYSGQRTRMAQDSQMLYQCLWNSLTLSAKKRINIYGDSYHINGDPVGALLLRIIVRESAMDTNVTVEIITRDLENLDLKMSGEAKNNIDDFNVIVMTLLEALAARGQRNDFILSHLFRGYLACSDANFREWIQRKKDEFDENGVNKVSSAQELMQWATQKYRTLKQHGAWDTPSEQAQQIIALQSEVNKLKKGKDKKGKGNKDTKSGAKSNSKSYSKSKTQKDKQSAYPKGMPTNDTRWRHKKPGELIQNLPVKDTNGKEWWWCGPETGGKCNPAQYRCHKPSECKGVAKDATKKRLTVADKKSFKQAKKKKQSKMLEAMMAAAWEDPSDEEEGEVAE